MKIHLKIMLIKLINSALKMKKKIKMKMKDNNLHGKTGDVSEKLNFTYT